MEHKHFKNSNWYEAYQLAIYKPGWGFEQGTAVKQIQVVREEDLNLRPPDYKSSVLTTRPHYLPSNPSLKKNINSLILFKVIQLLFLIYILPLKKRAAQQ